MKTEGMLSGIVNCKKLNVYSEPDFNSDVICKLTQFSEVIVDKKKSTKDFYKIDSAIGVEGFCQNSFITIASK